MRKKEITLCGKKVTLTYCYATEINYKILSDEDIADFMTAAQQAITDKKMPDIKKSILLIIAAMQPHYELTGKNMPLDDKTLMLNLSPEELGTAIGTIIGLRAEFYYIPTGEPKDSKKRGTTRPKA